LAHRRRHDQYAEFRGHEDDDKRDLRRGLADDRLETGFPGCAAMLS
jgi:hypothetical protein